MSEANSGPLQGFGGTTAGHCAGGRERARETDRESATERPREGKTARGTLSVPERERSREKHLFFREEDGMSLSEI